MSIHIYRHMPCSVPIVSSVGKDVEFSDRELAIIAIALDEEEEKKTKRRKFWVAPILEDRK